MLVLKRKPGEAVMIGDQIQVQVLGIEGDQIKLGFVAPKEVQILREELYIGIVSENRAAREQTNIIQPEQILSLLKNFKV